MAEKKNRSKVNERVGAVRMMNCGQKATCIAYRSSTDIDVQFEDRTVVRHRKWSNFKKGKVFNPNIAHSRVRKDRVGQSRKMNCGETATCIVYRNSDDIDVQFECGAVVEHVDWTRFVHGGVMCPTHRGRYAQIRTGQTRTMYNGQQATCVGYRRDNDIDVQFEDGTLVEHCRWKTFEQGKIRKPGGNKSRNKAVCR